MNRPTVPAGRRRGNRIAHEVVARQGAELVRPAVTIRIIALAVALTVIVQLERLAPIALCLPAVAGCVGRTWTRPRAAPSPPAPDVRSSADVERGSRPGPASSSAVQRRRWILGAWWDLPSALLVVAVAAWDTVALPASSRFLALAAAVVLLTVVCTRLCLDPRWFRPDPVPGAAARLVRACAGPLALAACLSVALPAPWEPGQRTIVIVISLLTLANVPLTRDQDLTVQSVVDMIRTEAQGGRQTVLDELHGNLSTSLRLLEQASLELRPVSPRLYELAVNANSRLRETLTLADPTLDSAGRPEALGALVRTLALAVGARADLSIGLDRLAEADRDLLRLVLNDVIRAVLADGGPQVAVTVRLVGGLVTVSVVGAGPAERGGVRIGLDSLRERLAAGGGTISEELAGDSDRRLAVVVRWPAGPGTA